MATKLSKSDYEFLKQYDPKELDQEQLDAINEYERSEAQAPSKDQLEWATYILNKKGFDQREAISSGDWDKAQSIINQERSAKTVMRQKGQDPYVHQVKEVPENVPSSYGFKFNWKDQYEKETGEKLKATEADAEKLRKYITSKMYDVTDDVNLQKIAYNMHLYNPNTMTWQEFLDSDNGKNFKSYLNDVQKYQQDKALDEIWNSEPIVDFMLPVTKEYARQHYGEINDKLDLAGPLAADAAANILMTGSGTGMISRKAPMLGKIYSNVAGPMATELGNVAINDKDIGPAAVGLLEGTLVNVGTPMAMSRGGNWIERAFGGMSEPLQKSINDAASKTREVAKKKSEGWIWRENGVFKKRVNGVDQEVKSLTKSDMNKVIPDKDIALAAKGERFQRGSQTDKAKLTNKLIEAKASGDPEKFKKELVTKVAKGETPTLEELQLAGFSSKESFANWLGDMIPEGAKEYLTNTLGRAQFGRRGVGSLINVYAPDVKLFKDKGDREKGTQKWYEYYGLSDWNK